jgi:hypothetical protein
MNRSLGWYVRIALGTGWAAGCGGSAGPGTESGTGSSGGPDTSTSATSTNDTSSGETTLTAPTTDITTSDATTTNVGTTEADTDPSTGAPAAPAWLAGCALNAWCEIAGTSGAGGAAINAWGTLVLVDGTGELVSPANGGHTDSADNRVSSIDLLADAPTWVVRKDPTPLADVVADAEYNLDMTPNSRHGYSHAHYIAHGVDRVMLFGGRGMYIMGGDGHAVDGFDLTSNTWDPPGTHASLLPGQGYGTVENPETGEVWTPTGLRWSPVDGTWTQVGNFTLGWRFPAAYDADRKQFFTLQFADGQGYDEPLVRASVFDAATGAQTIISFAPSEALTQFEAEQPPYAGMDHDPVNGRFLFLSGLGAAAGRVYVITPNDGAVWDMSLFSPAAGSVALISADNTGGINGKLKYVPALGGFVVLVNRDHDLYFLRTS